MQLKLVLVGAMLAMMASVSAASANTVTDTFTLSDGNMGAATASGTYGTETKGAKTFYFADMTVVENGGLIFPVTYTYNIDYNCLSSAPGCSPQLEAPSQYDPSFEAVLTITEGFYTGNPSTVPIAFSDFIFLFSGSGTLNEKITSTSNTPLPAALPLFATGFGALGLFDWRRKRKNAATLAAA